MLRSWCSLWLTAIYLLKISCTREIEDEEKVAITHDVKRPIWNVAHMVNALDQIDYYLNEGANSIECDVTFDSNGTAEYTYHGFPCDCFRCCTRYEDITTYIDYLRVVTTPGHEYYRKELVLLFMDCKVQSLEQEARIRAGEDLAMKLIDYYWLKGSSEANAYILISVPYISHMDFVQSFRNKLKSENFTSYIPKIGFDFSGNENLDSIRSAYESAGIDQNIWQGDGITNCLPRGTSRLREALRRRDQPGQTYIDKVYWWTVDRMSTMRAVLRMEVDGMITNYPDRLVTVLNEEEFSNKFRLATSDDNPWEKHPVSAASLANKLQEAREINLTDFLHEEEILYNC